MGCGVTSDHLQQTTHTFHTSWRILKHILHAFNWLNWLNLFIYLTQLKKVYDMCRDVQIWNSTSDIPGCFVGVLRHCMAFQDKKVMHPIMHYPILTVSHFTMGLCKIFQMIMHHAQQEIELCWSVSYYLQYNFDCVIYT